jgi:hypothetical protein
MLSVKALKKGMAIKKLRRAPKMAAIFLQDMWEWVKSFPISLRIAFNFWQGTERHPWRKSMVKPNGPKHELDSKLTWWGL